MPNLSGKLSEVKLWRGGGSRAGHRSVSAKGGQFARRDWTRATRKAVRIALRGYRPEAQESRINPAGYRAEYLNVKTVW